jgi:hypothetical protein
MDNYICKVLGDKRVIYFFPQTAAFMAKTSSSYEEFLYKKTGSSGTD